jgi:hypothetical protein
VAALRRPSSLAVHFKSISIFADDICKFGMLWGAKHHIARQTTRMCYCVRRGGNRCYANVRCGKGFALSPIAQWNNVVSANCVFALRMGDVVISQGKMPQLTKACLLWRNEPNRQNCAVLASVCLTAQL